MSQFNENHFIHVKKMNGERRYLTPTEIDKLIAACSDTDYPARNRAMILTAFRHGLRASELCTLKTDDIDFEVPQPTMHIKRSKRGNGGTHYVKDLEIRYLKDWKKERAKLFPKVQAPELFIGKRNAPLTPKGFGHLINSIGERAGLPFRVFPHMLRHACGYYLANEGRDARLIQEYLGHRCLNQVIVYTRVNPERFKDLF